MADDPDNTFIQPEGREAAENLPEDVLDRTQSLLYHELPKFFDETVTELEDCWIPDMRLRMVQLQRDQRRLSRSNSDIQASDLLKRCDELWNQVTTELIRNGVDQCQAALRQLSDDRLFKKHRKNLTPQQRKQVRGAALMDARNLRLDQLETTVEELIRTLKDVALSLESLAEEKVDDASASEMDDASDEEEEESQDLVPLSKVSENRIDPSERPLGEFDPHQHATKKRSRPPQDATNRSSNKRPSESNPKRAKASNRSAVGEPRSVGAGDDGSTRKRLPSYRPSGENANDNVAPLNQRAPQPDDTMVGDDDVSSVDDKANGSDDENDVPTFGLFDDEAQTSAATGVSTTEPQTRRRRRANATRGASTTIDHSCAETASARRNHVPISQRMQEFLEKNNALRLVDEDDEIATDRAQPLTRKDIRRRVARRRNQLRDERQRYDREPAESPSGGRSQPIDRSESVPEAVQRRSLPSEITMEFLLSELGGSSRSAGPNTEASSSRRTTDDAPSVAFQIKQCYAVDPHQASRLLTQAREIVQRIEDDSDQGNAAVFESCSKILTTQGMQILTELIACQSPRLGAQVHLLSVLAKDRRPDWLQGSRAQFLDLLVLQLVDATFALLNPDGWALKITNRVAALRHLEPLRDVLAEEMSLIEVAARCIMDQLPCQEWRLSLTGDRLFVSSLDPDVWRQFVANGECKVPRESRYHKLGSVWPRTEVEAAWKVFLFLGAAKSRKDDNQRRWQLASKLFSSHVLAKPVEPSEALPPNPLQLSCFESDTRHLTQLLRNGALDNLPHSDKLVINLIKRGIRLQAEDYLGNEESWFRAFPSLGVSEKATTRFVARLWKHTHSLMLIDTSAVQCQQQGVHDINLDMSRSLDKALKVDGLLLPTSNVFASCLSLLVAWSQRLPEKRVRQQRFLKQLRSLRESLHGMENEVASQQVTKAASDAFADAFQDECPLEVGDSATRLTTFFSEVSSCLTVFETILDTPDGGNNTTGPKRSKALSRQTLKEVSMGCRIVCALSCNLTMTFSDVGVGGQSLLDQSQAIVK